MKQSVYYAVQRQKSWRAPWSNAAPRVRPRLPTSRIGLAHRPPGMGQTSLDIRYPPPPMRRDRTMAGLALSGSPGQGFSQSAPVSRSGPHLRLPETRTRPHRDFRPARLGLGPSRKEGPFCQEIVALWRGEGLTGLGRWMKAGTDGSVGERIQTGRPGGGPVPRWPSRHHHL